MQYPKGLGGIQWWHCIDIPGYGYTEGSVNYPKSYGPDWAISRFGMPADLTGKSVLDIGAWDGLMSFEAEKRGASSVLAVDCPKDQGGTWAGSDGFHYAKKALNSKVQWQPYNLEMNNPPIEAQFDVVLCFGVLYHLKSPLPAMTHLFNLTADNGLCVVETAVATCGEKEPILQYKPHSGGDPTNYFYPNDAWMELASKEAGFKSCTKVFSMHLRATYLLKKDE